MSKNIIYVASCRDLATGERLQSSKVGIATSDADKRIRTLNSTKQPFAVELEAAWTFEKTPLNADDIEAVVHSLLEPDRVNGEWFRDPEGDLADRVGKAISKLGGVPVGDDNQDLADMNHRRLEALTRMQSVFEPIRKQLLELDITWEYLTRRVAINSGIGRIKIQVTKKSGLYLGKGNCHYTAKQLSKATGLNWRQGEQDGRVMCSNLTTEQLLHILAVTKDWNRDDDA